MIFLHRGIDFLQIKTQVCMEYMTAYRGTTPCVSEGVAFNLRFDHF
jgi:hypothetical protein